MEPQDSRRLVALPGHDSFRLVRQHSQYAHEHGPVRPDRQDSGYSPVGSCWVHRFASGFRWLPGLSLSLPRPWPRRSRQVSARGYRWLKYHVDVFQNAIDQTAAMQEAAPPGFKVHYDFNADSELATVYPVLRELEKFPVAGQIEDPINVEDHEAWKALRTKCSLPLIFHYGLDPTEFYVRHGLCDGFVASVFP